jgi:hypothetical protein
MPFYFRIPLPGPLGYSKRIGGKRRKAVPQPVRTLTRAERQEQRERDIRRARTFIVRYAAVIPAKSFLADRGYGFEVMRELSSDEYSGWVILTDYALPLA